MGFFKNFAKTRKFRNISNVLSKPIISGHDLLFDDSKDRALEKLLRLSETDQNVRMILKRHDVSREQLKRLYSRLNASGAGQWVGKHYVSASAIYYPQSLDYLLRKLEKGSLPAEAAYRVVKYFEKGETGPIES